MVPCWNKIISDPSSRRWLTVLKLFYFTHGPIINNFSETPPIGGVSCAGTCWRADISDFCLPATAACCLTITVHECSDWLQHCLMNIHAKIILFHIRRGSIKRWNSVKFFKIILGVVPCWNKIILGLSTDSGGSGLKFFKMILFWHGTTAL